MSAVSKNPFDALGDDEEDVEAVKKDVREVKKAAAPAKTSAAPAAAAAKEAPKAQAGAADSNRRPPRREYDRHSGTGRGRRADGAEDKRGGSGKYNWGTKDAGTTPNDEADQGEPRELTEEEKAAAEAAAEAKRKEESQITFDEFMKTQQAKEEAEKLEARRVEAIDMKGLKVKSDEGEQVWTIGDEDKGGKGKGKKSGRKATAFVDANFSMPAVETGPSGGGRGRGRGRGDFRPRSGGGAAPPPAPAVSMDNFPSLG